MLLENASFKKNCILLSTDRVIIHALWKNFGVLSYFPTFLSTFGICYLESHIMDSENVHEIRQ